jgi:hypothetical protein
MIDEDFSPKEPEILGIHEFGKKDKSCPGTVLERMGKAAIVIELVWIGLASENIGEGQ